MCLMMWAGFHTRQSKCQVEEVCINAKQPVTILSLILPAVYMVKIVGPL